MLLKDDPLKCINLDTSWDALERVLKGDWPRSLPIYCLIKTRRKWLKKQVEGNQFKVCCPGGVMKDGIVFFGEKGTSTFYLNIHPIHDDLTRLTDAIIRTNRIDWSEHFNCGVPENHVAWFKEVILPALGFRLKKELPTHFYDLSKEEALDYKIVCPSGTYLSTLDAKDVPTIDAVWPHSFDDSPRYLIDTLRLNFGLGLYSSDHRLMSWVMKYEYGDVAVLQTDQEFKRRGYGSLVTKALAKMLIQNDDEVYAFVVVGNKASETMFKGIGFRYAGSYNFIDYEMKA